MRGHRSVNTLDLVPLAYVFALLLLLFLPFFLSFFLRHYLTTPLLLPLCPILPLLRNHKACFCPPNSSVSTAKRLDVLLKKYLCVSLKKLWIKNPFLRKTGSIRPPFLPYI